MTEKEGKKIGKRRFIIPTLAVSLLLCSFLVSAIGVANSYWNTNPLKLAPGQSTLVTLRLQNEDNKSVTVNVTLNSNIAYLVNGSQYIVPPGKVSVPVYINVSIPNSAAIGASYSILASFQQVASGQGPGFFQVAQAITNTIPVEVVSSAESQVQTPQGNVTGSNIGVIILAIVVLVIVILGVVFIKRKKK